MEQPVPLARQDVGAAAEPLIRAFVRDPLWTAILPDEAGRVKGLRALFRFMLAYGIRKGEVYTTSPRFEGTAIWLPARYASTDNLAAVWSGALRVPLAIRGESMRRMQQAGETIKRIRLRLCPGDHWYLAGIGVDPQHQGKGLARRLLEPMLARFELEKIPVCLDTAEESNVGLYRHLGFEVREETVIPGVDLRIWGMLKVPGGVPRP